MSENFAFPIPNSVLEPYIKAAVSTAIMQAIGDGKELVKKAVAAALTQKVDSYGNISRNSYENRYNLVEVLATSQIQKIAQETIKEVITELRPQIEIAAREHIQKQTGEIARLLVDGMLESVCQNWNISVNLKPNRIDD